MSGFSDLPDTLCLFDPRPAPPSFKTVHLKLNTASSEALRGTYKQFRLVAGNNHEIERQLFVTKRKIKKAKNETGLRDDEACVYRHYQYLLSRDSYMFTCAHSFVSKRMLNYFVVVYAKQNKVCYYVDKSKCPFEVIGQIGSSLGELPPEKQLSAYFVDLYLHYKESKEKRMRRLVGMSPYARGPVVKNGKRTYPLSEMQFMWWFSQVAGMSAFALLRTKVLQSKYEFEKAANTKH